MKGLSLVELLTAVVLLGLGLIGLAAGSGWMAGSTRESLDQTGRRVAALRAAVEEVSAVPFEALSPGRRRQGGVEVRWILVEETPESVLVRFVATDVVRPGSTARSRDMGTAGEADTLEYRRARP